MKTEPPIPNPTYLKNSSSRLEIACRILLLLPLLTLPAFGQAQDYTYITNDGTISITKYIGAGGAVTIPSAITGLPVTTIDRAAFHSCTFVTGLSIPTSVTDIRDYAFYSCEGLSEVNIPNSVTNIGHGAFFHCIGLASLILPDNLNRIGDCAFAQCSSLVSVKIPSSVANLEYAAFYACTSLTAISVDSESAFYSSLDGVLFNKDKTTLVEWPDGKGQSYTIPDSVTSIGEFAFYCSRNLTNVNIPNSVTNIERFAFSSCERLTSVTIPNSVTRIAEVAFSGCSNLRSVTVPANVTEIGMSAFGSCSQLSAINVDVSNKFFSDMDGILFNKLRTKLIQYPAAKLGDYEIPRSVSSIERASFSGCAGLTSIVIPNGVTFIPNGAFDWCTSLTRVSLPANLTTIGANAFFFCYALTNVTIPRSVSYIADSAFAGCFALSAIYFDGNAPGIGGYVLDRDDRVTVYYMPGTSGWGSTFAGRPAVLWNPQVQTGAATFGVRTNCFGFTITGTPDIPVVVEACAALQPSAIWVPLQNCTLTNGSLNFSDPEGANYPSRFYRIRSP